ncbi:addiction module toxin RelE [Spirochaetia bacterium]|nr:addiction module toxin RelE [Spirochaetia bacterium]
MRIFKNTWFSRFARKEGIEDGELKVIVNEVLEADLADADYGGGVYKVRIARPGEGKSGGYRVIVLFKNRERTFFVYGFAKSGRDNLDQKEVRHYKELAKDHLNLTDAVIKNALQSGKFVEI